MYNQNSPTHSVRTNKKWSLLLIPILLALAVCLNGTTTIAQTPGDDPIAVMTVGATEIEWRPLVDHAGLILAVSGPGDLVYRQEFEASSVPTFGLIGAEGQRYPDGAYTYELLATPVVVVDTDTRANPAAARESGQFTIQDGAFVTDSGSERQPSSPMAPADILHYDDVIITGSECVGFDCRDGESFGLDTIILKEHNLRIYFNDTSYTASYPTNNWRISINDSTNGGASYFSIDDVDDGTHPFRVEAGSPSCSLYVEDYGRIGMGTCTPVVEAHIKDSDTPTVRLEQDSSGGWAAQTWDVVGNESNFFIRDATNGSKLPFRIQPSTPSSLLCLKADRRVGIGTWSPGYPMELETTGEDATFVAERTSGASAIFSAGEEAVQIGSASGHDLQFIAEGVAMTLTQFGDLYVLGTVYDSSDVHAKENFAAIDGEDVLARLAGIPITTWNYKTNDDAARHLGPMAQDFYAAFALGSDERYIAPLDASGVALAAVQELDRIAQAQDAQIAQLEQQNADLEARVAALEALVETLLQAESE